MCLAFSESSFSVQGFALVEKSAPVIEYLVNSPTE